LDFQIGTLNFQDIKWWLPLAKIELYDNPSVFTINAIIMMNIIDVSNIIIMMSIIKHCILIILLQIWPSASQKTECVQYVENLINDILDLKITSIPLPSIMYSGITPNNPGQIE
jgi:hypothetical protein